MTHVHKRKYMIRTNRKRLIIPNRKDGVGVLGIRGDRERVQTAFMDMRIDEVLIQSEGQRQQSR